MFFMHALETTFIPDAFLLAVHKCVRRGRGSYNMLRYGSTEKVFLWKQDTLIGWKTYYFLEKKP